MLLNNSEHLPFIFLDSSTDKTMEDGFETASTSASTVTDITKEKFGPPAIVTFQKYKEGKDKDPSKDDFLAYLESLEKSKDDMEEEKEGEEEEEDKKPAAVSTTTSSVVTTIGTSNINSVASMNPVASMPAAAGANGVGSTSVASTVTAASSFTTPTKKGGVFEIRRFCASSGGGGNGGSGTMSVSTPTRRTPTLEVIYWQIGFTVVAICNLLNERGKESYA